MASGLVARTPPKMAPVGPSRGPSTCPSEAAAKENAPGSSEQVYPPEPQFYRLEPKLVFQIIGHLDSTGDLYALISASQRILRMFNGASGALIHSVLKNAMPPDTMRHALSVITVPEIRERGETRQHLARYFGQKFTIWGMNDTHYRTLAKLHAQIRRVTNDCASHALGAVWEQEPLLPEDRSKYYKRPLPRPLSANERMVIERAFYRFELYTRVFPLVPNTDGQTRVPYVYEHNRRSQHDVSFQANYFVARLEPFEVEEMACVHQYFVMRLGSILDACEVDIRTRIEAVGERSRSIQLKSRGNTCAYSSIAEAGLELLSSRNRAASYDILGFYASLGINWLTEVLFAQSYKHAWHLMRKEGPASREFLPDAVRYAVETGSIHFTDFTSRLTRYTPGHGFSEFKHSSDDTYLEMKYPEMMDYYPLRRMGYVFWDEEFIEQPDEYLVLLEASDTRPQQPARMFDRSILMAADWQLYGVTFPKTLARQLVEEYGNPGAALDLCTLEEDDGAYTPEEGSSEEESTEDDSEDAVVEENIAKRDVLHKASSKVKAPENPYSYMDPWTDDEDNSGYMYDEEDNSDAPNESPAEFFDGFSKYFDASESDSDSERSLPTFLRNFHQYYPPTSTKPREPQQPAQGASSSGGGEYGVSNQKGVNEATGKELPYHAATGLVLSHRGPIRDRFQEDDDTDYDRYLEEPRYTARRREFADRDRQLKKQNGGTSSSNKDKTVESRIPSGGIFPMDWDL